MRVLVLDDSHLMRRMMRRALRQAGIASGADVVEGVNGEQGLRLLSEQAFDLVLCDYCMPEVDGGQFLAAANKQLRRIPPVLMVTAQDSPEIHETMRRQGSSGFLRKPFTSEELRHAIEMALQ